MTFSVLAIRDGLIGAAVGTCTLSVGAAVPALAPGVGGVLTQGWTNRRFRAQGLDLLRSGMTAPDALERMLKGDEDRALRQVALIDADGRVAVHSGEGLTEWAGAIVGDSVVFMGNFLTGPDVVTAMAESWDAGTEPLPERLALTLAAGDWAGGDKRGRMSAALMVAQFDEADVFPPELMTDLRVDDDPAAVATLVELERKWAAHRATAVVERRAG